MSYVGTVPHRTFRHAIRRPHLHVRRANVIHGLGFWAAIPAIVTAVTAVGTATYGIYAAKKDSKDAKKQAEKDAKQAVAETAAAMAEQKRVNDALIAQGQRVSEAKAQQTEAATAAVTNYVPLGIAGIVGLTGVLIFLRMRRAKKRK